MKSSSDTPSDTLPMTEPSPGVPSPSRLPYHGLTSAEVEQQRAKFGSNVLTPPPRDPWWKQFLEKFDDPVIRILIIAAVIAIGTGEWVEGLGIVVAILLATGLAFLNEFKANREFDILNQVNDEIPIKVVRDGGFLTVPIKDLVVGDVVFIEAGEEVPADGGLVEAVSLQVNESALTGETHPNYKYTTGQLANKQLSPTTIPADHVMRGTKVMDGHGVLEVTEVGDSTEIGKTARAGLEETGEQTPLNAQLERLSKLIGIVGLSVAVVTFFALVFYGAATGKFALTAPQWTVMAIVMIGASIVVSPVWLPMIFDGLEVIGEKFNFQVRQPAWLGGDDDAEDEDNGGGLVRWLKVVGAGAGFLVLGLGISWALGAIPATVGDWLPEAAASKFLGYFMIAVTIIVVAVPEGLAMSVTLSLAYSMRKMTASNTLVRKSHACETIGAATMICSDKTGTLTQNEMRVFEVDLPALNGKPLSEAAGNPVGSLIFEGLSANTTAHLSHGAEGVEPLGNPTEGALLLWLHGQGLDYVKPRSDFDVTYQMTFSTERKYMATLGRSPRAEKPVLYVKGAPEIVLSHCSRLHGKNGPEPIDSLRESIHAKLQDYQARGMRTLALAYHDELPEEVALDVAPAISELTWLGFVAIADPVRPEVPAAIRACREAGIGVKIVTGDNANTAEEIARQIGLWETGDAKELHLQGTDFQALSDADAREAASRLKILSRARPMDKVRLVRSLQEQGEVVAVTGDGINDCGALNYANVGMAMGRTGKSAAKEASDIVLLDDSFGTIIKAVMWGRSLYENIQRFILFQLTINVAALGIAMLGPFIGVMLPLTVIQMLWVNLIMDTFAALALATEPPHPAVLKRPPRSPKAFIITPRMAAGIIGMGGLFLVVMLGLLRYLEQGSGGTISSETASWELTVFFSVFVMLQFWNLFNARCLGLTHSAFTGLWQNKSLLAIAAAIFVGTILLVQFGGEMFRTVPLSFRDWAVIVAATSLVLWGGEIYRFIRRTQQQPPVPDINPAI